MVPVNRPNKDGEPSAEGEEGRPMIKENANQPHTSSTVKVGPTPPSQSLTSVLKYRYERSTGSIYKAEADFGRGQADRGRVREQRSNESCVLPTRTH